MEKVRLYLIDKFQDKVSPDKPVCTRLQVRRDFKCLTETERLKFVDVMRQLYLDGTMTELGDIHSRYWGMVHTGVQFPSFHRQLVYVLEQKMQQIDPDITLPYWSNPLDFNEPHKSILWKYLGTSGKEVHGFCVKDGLLFTGLNLTRCVRRQWNNHMIPPLESPELATSFIQRYDLSIIAISFLAGLHFVPHLAVGGYGGDMSVDTAAYDIIFYMFHLFQLEVLGFRNQFKNRDKKSTPRDDYYYDCPDVVTGEPTICNSETAPLLHWTNITLSEAYRTGIQPYCSIPDSVAEAIINNLNGVQPVIPQAIQDMNPLAKQLFFPAFASGNYDWLDFYLPNVGNGCNADCKPIPRFQSFMDTPNGLRCIRNLNGNNNNTFKEVGIMLAQNVVFTIVDGINAASYCSPYIT